MHVIRMFIAGEEALSQHFADIFTLSYTLYIIFTQDNIYAIIA